MISLVFLICTNVQCMTLAPEETFTTLKDCELTAQFIMAKAQSDPSIGTHTAQYECKVWGKPL